MDALLAYGDDSDQESDPASPNTSSEKVKEGAHLNASDSFFIEGEDDGTSASPIFKMKNHITKTENIIQENTNSQIQNEKNINIDNLESHDITKVYESKLLNEMYPLNPKATSMLSKDQILKDNKFKFNLLQVINDKNKTDITEVITSSREFGNPEALQWVVDYFRIDDSSTKFSPLIYDPKAFDMETENYISLERNSKKIVKLNPSISNMRIPSHVTSISQSVPHSSSMSNLVNNSMMNGVGIQSSNNVSDISSLNSQNLQQKKSSNPRWGDALDALKSNPNIKQLSDLSSNKSEDQENAKRMRL